MESQVKIERDKMLQLGISHLVLEDAFDKAYTWKRFQTIAVKMNKLLLYEKHG